MVINVTTDKVYENLERDRAFREDEPKGGHDPYSNSKACAELVTSAYRDSFFASGAPIAVASARAGNVIGGGDWGEDRLVPDLIRGALARRAVPIRNPDAIRPWQHVLNPLSGYLRAGARRCGTPRLRARRGTSGPTSATTLSCRRRSPTGSRSYGAAEFRGSTTRGSTRTRPTPCASTPPRRARGWAGRPRWDLDQALASIAEWYAGLAAGEDPRALVLKQVEAFEAAPARR